MKQRIIIGVVLLLVGALGWWIARNTYWDEVSIPSPLSGEALRNPFYAAQRYAEALGTTTERRVSLGAVPAQDSILLLTYWHWSLIQSRREQLQRWVENGGRLVLDRTVIGGERELKEWSGLELTERDYDDEEEDEEDEEQEEESADQDVFEAAGLGDSVCGRIKKADARDNSDLLNSYSICELAEGSWITSSRPVAWALHDDDGMQATRIDIGKGSVTLLNATPFGNRTMLEVDHPALLVAVTQLRRGDRLIFLSEEEHPSILELTWTYGKPVVLLAALFVAIALWRGAQRFGPPIAPTETARRSLIEQIRGIGLFTLRFGGDRTLHAAMLRALDAAARRRIYNYEGLTAEKRVATLARATELDADKLAAALNHTGSRSVHDLQQTIALLETARRRLIENAHRPIIT